MLSVLAAAALALPGLRVEVLAVDLAPRGCDIAHVEAPRRAAASGRLALRVTGREPNGHPCRGWAWAQVRVTSPTLVATRALARGEPLAGAVTIEEREILPGHAALGAAPPDARTRQPVPAGATLDPSWIQVGPLPGDPVVVILRAGALAVEEEARAVPCRAGHACARLLSGRRVEGRWHAGRIVLETP